MQSKSTILSQIQLKIHFMKALLFLEIIVVILSFTSCDENFIDTGLANGNHECSMYEYLKSDPSNWDSLVLLIERAELVDLINGNDPVHKQITLLGITNFSFAGSFLEMEDDNSNPKCINDLSPELCRDIVLSHLIETRMLRSQFEPEIKGTLQGGTEVTTFSGRKVRIYLKENNEWGVNLGSNAIGVEFKSPSNIITDVASGDIQTSNGIVHSLVYPYRPILDYDLGD